MYMYVYIYKNSILYVDQFRLSSEATEILVLSKGTSGLNSFTVTSSKKKTRNILLSSRPKFQLGKATTGLTPRLSLLFREEGK